jgi:transcriptional regulator GlxA family with amidase domain
MAGGVSFVMTRIVAHTGDPQHSQQRPLSIGSCQYRDRMRTIALVVFDGARLFDVAVASEVWAPRRISAGLPEFRLRTCSVDGAPVLLTGGTTAAPDADLRWLTHADLVVIPGPHDPAVPVPAALLDALRRAHQAGTEIAALCAGAFVLAAAGLLDNRPAITHCSWEPTGCGPLPVSPPASTCACT